ncbi:MAG: peptidase domain-containing ABC transporter [Saprospiraceae bacterium]
MSFPLHRQLDAMDCGPACLRMVAGHYGRRYTLQQLRQRSHLDREGVSARGIVSAAEGIGLRALPVKLPFQGNGENDVGFLEAPLPNIVHWNQKHFVVVYKTSKKHVWVADPAQGKSRMTHARFRQHWESDAGQGVAILLEPTPDFYAQEGEETDFGGFGFLLKYLRPYRQLVWQLVLGLVFTSTVQFLFPFITQSIVDTGIENQDLDFIYLMLLAQIVLLFGIITSHFLQNWILLHIGTRVNVALVSDFLQRLMRQPVSFFDTKMTGDLLQRISDHQRIEDFLTVRTLGALLSSFNLVIFGVVLALYNLTIFFIFAVSSILYIAWIFLFLPKRVTYDNMRFAAMSDNQSTLVELIQGMQEIKLQNSERKRRYGWVHVQARLFRANVRMLALNQWQDAGGNFIIHINDFAITAIAAISVVQGEMTLGMMLAVLYIIGQIQVPLTQLYVFIRTAQDAKLSLERLGEIHDQQDVQNNGSSANTLYLSKGEFGSRSGGNGFTIENLSFRYNALSDFVLKNIDLEIPEGKVTAIVGTSGSGKTTLVKLLLGFYEPSRGSIKVGQTYLNSIHPGEWRDECGAVMQDGFIFSDTIASNIAESDPEGVDKKRLLTAVRTANIQEFIEEMPLGYNTMVGARGNGLSQGQRQRVLIARAIYKDPAFLFFDEATNALDAHNEKIIMENLNRFFQGRTVIVVAHRLSTVKNADQIIVLEKGNLVEKGTHEELTARRGAYYHLVKEQLELGN